MNILTDERMDLALQLKDIEFQDERRKKLILLCVMRALSLSPGSAINLASDTNEINTATSLEKRVLKTAKAPLLSSSTPSSSQGQLDPDTLQKRIHGFELQVASLKMQLSTNEQAHAAKVDELRGEIDRLQNESSTTSTGLGILGKSRLSKNRVKYASTVSPVSKPSRPMSLFFANSPFSDLKSSRGNSFSGVGIASIAALASLKLSRTAPEQADEVFSPNNSSAESTPKQTNSGSDQPARKALETNGKAAETGTERPTTVNMVVSDPEETFHSANGTFDTDKDRKTKKRKIRLLSSEASKLLLALQNRDHDSEADDLNSLKYYQDDNFDKNTVPPVQAQKRLSTVETVPKKKHVFKIGDPL